MPYIFPPPPPQSPFLDSISQTMLLNKRLTTFLSQNTTPQLPTLLLLSPTGKLLTNSSPLSATALRTQATLACSLWVLYQPSIPSLISSSLPQTQNQIDTTTRNGPRGSDSTIGSGSTATEHELSTITIQLEKGIMVIRQLSCGLLFVAIGSPPPPAANSSPRPSSNQLSSQASPPSSPPAQAAEGVEDGNTGSLLGRGSAAASEAGSVRSVGGTRTGIMGVRRRADEVGKWLDGQLEGFVLSSGDGR